MDRDVESKLRKFCEKYAKAAADIELVRPVRLPSGKSQRRTELRVARIIEELAQVRRGDCRAMVRLAYVRAMREQAPEMRLNVERGTEVNFLVERLSRNLDYLEHQALLEFRRHLSHLITAETMRAMGVGSRVVDLIEQAGGAVPLEQRARASATSILELAQTAGSLAAASSGAYDGVPNVP